MLALVVICSFKALESERASLAIWSVTVKLLFNLVIESLWEVIVFSEELTLLVRELKALESTLVAKSSLALLAAAKASSAVLSVTANQNCPFHLLGILPPAVVSIHKFWGKRSPSAGAESE